MRLAGEPSQVVNNISDFVAMASHHGLHKLLLWLAGKS
jgi:hypothetical protein